MPAVRRFSHSRSHLILLLVLGSLATGCQTTGGGYVANRGRDFGECFLIQFGIGPGLGAQVNAAGLVHIGGIGGLFSPGASMGWVYGEARPDERSGGPFEIHPAYEGDLGLPLASLTGGKVHGWSRYSHSGEGRGHECYGILPAIFCWSGGDWIWGKPDLSWLEDDPVDEAEKEATRRRRQAALRWARMHVFDIEVSASVIFLGARVGFSPGEFLDFLLGWVGVDIAGDDLPWTPEETKVPESTYPPFRPER